MHDNFKISCKINTSDQSVPLGIEIWLDNDKIFDQDWVKETVDFEHVFDKPNGNHELKFVMKNKKPSHTTIDSCGNIIKDAMLSITKIFFDDIDLENVISQVAVYTHDFNGTGNQTQIKFHKDMGCNGTVSVKFSTPYYIWLLENM